MDQIKIEEPEEFKDIVRLDNKPKFRPMTMAEIEVEQQKLITETVEEQGVSKTLARMLLIKNGWDTAKVAKKLEEEASTSESAIESKSQQAVNAFHPLVMAALGIQFIERKSYIVFGFPGDVLYYLNTNIGGIMVFHINRIWVRFSWLSEMY